MPAIGRAWREILGRHFPAMALVQVVALIEDRAKIEIETTALIPDDGDPQNDLTARSAEERTA